MKELYLYKSVYHDINLSTMHFTAEFKAIITDDGQVDIFFSFPLTFLEFSLVSRDNATSGRLAERAVS